MHKRFGIMIAAIIVLIGALGAVAGARQDQATAAQDGNGLGEIGSPVPQFSLTTYDGKTFSTADFKGKVTKLIFWFPT